MGISIPALQKHVSRLLGSGLVEKNGEGKILLSPSGHIALEQVPFFEFISNFKNYFKEHTFGSLPSKFIHRIGELRNCEIIPSEMASWDKQRQSLVEAKEFSYGMTTQIPLEAYDIFLKKIKEGMRLRGLVGKNTIVAKGHAKLMKEIGLHQKIPKEKMEKRMIDKIDVFVIATERDAFASFADKNGNADLSSIFYSKDESFRQWCLDVFDYYWQNSSPYDQSKLKER